MPADDSPETSRKMSAGLVIETLTLYLLVLSADNLCKQFGPRSDPTSCRSGYDSKLFDIMKVLLKEFFAKVDFEKNQQTTKKHAKLPSRHRVN